MDGSTVNVNGPESAQPPPLDSPVHHGAMTVSINPREVRPARWWYLVAGVLAAVGVVGGLVGFVWGARTAESSVPAIEQPFHAGQPTTVELSGRPQIIWVDEYTITTADIDCAASGVDGGSVRVGPVSMMMSAQIDGHAWKPEKDLSASPAGRYTITCTSRDGRTDAVFAIGDRPDEGRFAGGVIGGLASVFGFGCPAVVIAGVIVLVVGVRRYSHRTRLVRARTVPPWPYGPPRV